MYRTFKFGLFSLVLDTENSTVSAVSVERLEVAEVVLQVEAALKQEHDTVKQQLLIELLAALRTMQELGESL